MCIYFHGFRRLFLRKNKKTAAARDDVRIAQPQALTIPPFR
jgi:hypothetical protein